MLGSAIVGKQQRHHRGIPFFGTQVRPLWLAMLGSRDRRQQQRHHRGEPFSGTHDCRIYHSGWPCWGPRDRRQAAASPPRRALGWRPMVPCRHSGRQLRSTRSSASSSVTTRACPWTAAPDAVTIGVVGHVEVHAIVGKQQRQHRGVPFGSGTRSAVKPLAGHAGVHAIVRSSSITTEACP